MASQIIMRKSDEDGNDGVNFDVVFRGVKQCSIKIYVDFHSRIMTTEIRDIQGITDVRHE